MKYAKSKIFFILSNHQGYFFILFLCFFLIAPHAESQRSTQTHESSVKLISFSGYTDKDIISLQWRTSGEININHFELQASCNGVHFKNINRQTAKSINKSIESYQAEDFKPSHGNNFYQLKIVNNYGKTIYAKIITVNYK